MAVHKSTTDKYEIYAQGEHATICISDCATASSSEPGEVTYSGELLVHSSFGAFAHTWRNCGSPFREFLQKIDMEYFIGKMRGAEAYVFAGEPTFQTLLHHLDELQADESISEADAALLRKSFEENRKELIADSHSFFETMKELEDEHEDVKNASYLFMDLSEHVATKPDPQLVGFWTILWPEFLAAIRVK